MVCLPEECMHATEKTCVAAGHGWDGADEPRTERERERSGQKLGCVSAGLTTRWTHAAASGDDGDAHGWDGYKARASYFLGLHGTHGRPRTRNYYTAARNDLARCLWVNTAAGAYSPSEVTCFLS